MIFSVLPSQSVAVCVYVWFLFSWCHSEDSSSDHFQQKKALKDYRLNSHSSFSLGSYPRKVKVSKEDFKMTTLITCRLFVLSAYKEYGIFVAKLIKLIQSQTLFDCANNQYLSQGRASCSNSYFVKKGKQHFLKYQHASPCSTPQRLFKKVLQHLKFPTPCIHHER